jgi:hypothetical protein
MDCPAGPYSDKRVYYTKIDDQRNCSACSCGSDCSYQWQVFADSDTSCGSGPVDSATSAGACLSAGTLSASNVVLGMTASGSGGCTPSGGDPTGSAQAKSPYTACCVP